MNPVLDAHLQKKIQSNPMTYLNPVLLTPSTILLPHLLQVFNQSHLPRKPVLVTLWKTSHLY